MTRAELIKHLKAFTEAAVKDMVLPVRRQEDDEEPPAPRAAEVFLMGLEKSASSKKAAPYVIHQVIAGKDVQPEGGRASALAVVRSIFCVYHEDEQEGALSLLGLMERLRIELLKEVVIAGQFELSLEGDGLEMLVYPDDTAPYYSGEMISTWRLPGVERKVDFHHGY